MSESLSAKRSNQKGDSMNNHICCEIKCPYFTSETGKSLSCEGPDVGMINTMRFRDEGKKIDYIKKHCVNYPNECHLFKAVEAHYEQVLSK